MKKFVLGIDVGGTNIKLGLVDRSGVIIARTNLITASYVRNKTKLIGSIIEGSKALFDKASLKRKDILGIGVGLPGLIDFKNGIVFFLPNIPGWHNVHLQNILQKKLRIPTFLDNDVNIITLGEWKFGAGIGAKNMICMTLGTGVGSGLILNSKLYRGEGYAAGEIGHLPLNEHDKSRICNCGSFACFERYVGNKYLQQRAAQIFKNKNITLEEVYQMALKKDKHALAFWQEVGTHIGNALTGVVNFLNPTRIVIGGGVSKSYRFFYPTVLKIIQRRAMRVQRDMVKILKAKLGDDAGIIGARVLVTESLLMRR